MRATKRLTLSAIIVALGAVFMSIGALFPSLDLTAVALASLLMAFVYMEIGSPYTWLVWICTTLAVALLYFGSLIWAEYLLVFGIYPVLKGYIERLGRGLWLLLKLAYANLTLALLALVGEFVIGVPLFSGESIFGLAPWAVYAILWVALNFAFLLYDIFINVMVRFYMQKLRPRIKTLLK